MYACTGVNSELVYVLVQIIIVYSVHISVQLNKSSYTYVERAYI